MIDITINGKGLSVERGVTILEAAGELGVRIPTLCHHEGLPPEGSCRVCTVEIEQRGGKKLVASCMFPITGPIAVETESDRAVRARKFVIGLLLNRNPKAIAINELAKEYGVTPEERFASEPDLCIRCARCVRACEINGTNAIAPAGTGFGRFVSAPYGQEPESCVGCASCAEVCPTGKITYNDTDGARRIWEKTFDLVRCARCGAQYATKEQIARVGTGEEDARFCEKCRRAVFGERFKKS